MMNLQLFALDDDKLDSFSFNYSDQVDEWGKSVGDYQVIQQSMDSRAEELRVKYNSLIDQLVSLLGATEVGATKLSDGSSLSDIQTELEYLQTELQNVVLDQVPDNTLTYQKLAQLVRQDIQSMYKIYDAGGTATNVTVTTDEGNFTYSNGKWVQFEVKIAGTISDVNIDGQGAIGLEDKEGELLDVEVGDIIIAKYDAGGGTPFFLGASRGGSLDRSFLQQYDLTNEVLLNEKDKEISVKVGEYVNCEFYETFINDGGAGQVIPPTTQVTDTLKSLLHMDGTDGSTTFTDETGISWTANGNAQIDTAESKFGGASALFDGTGDWIDTPDSDYFNLGSNDFTIDFWAKKNVNGVVNFMCGQINSSAQVLSASFDIAMLDTNLVRARVSDGSSFYTAQTNGTITDTLWHHIALVRDGNTLRLFIDGTQDGTSDLTGVTVHNSSNKMAIGRGGEFVSIPFNGHIDEFRFVNGEAKWTTNFTPPTSAYVYSEESNPNNRALIDGTLEMNELTEGYVYEGHITKTQQWLPSMEGADNARIYVQSGGIVVTSTSVDVAIDSVDLNISYVKAEYTTPVVGNPQARYTQPLVYLLDENTVRIEITAYNSSYRPTVYWEVIQDEAIENVQYFTGTASSATENITTESVNLEKSMTYVTAKSSSASTGPDEYVTRYATRQTTSTNLAFYNTAGGTNMTYGIYLVERR